SAGSCSSNTCSPGVYTNLQLKGGTFTLQSGTYILQSTGNKPAFEIGPGSGGTTVNGSDVTLVFANSYPSGNNKPMFAIDSNSSVNLTAPSTGNTAGFLIMGAPSMPLGTLFDTSQANPGSILNGIVYLPNGDVHWAGNPVTGSASCLEL